jgi:multiple sugar transport system substrate-binding protein
MAACALLCAMGVAGCVGGVGGTGGQSFDPGDAFDPGKQYTVTFYGWGDASEIANYKSVIAAFRREYPNVTVSYDYDNASEYPQNLRNRANDLPDVFYVPDTEFLMWADSGKLLDIAPAFTEGELGEIWPEAADKYYYNRDSYRLGKAGGGKLYGLPKDLGPFTLCYNKTLLNSLAAEKGVTQEELDELLSPTEPMSWAEFRALLGRLDTDRLDKVWGVTHYELQAAVYSNNADFFSADQTEQRITEKNFTDALQFIADLSLVDGVMPSAAAQTAENGYQRFFMGDALFSFMGPWDCASFWESVAFEYDVLPVPYGPAEGARSTAWVGSMSYSLSAAGKAKPAALLFAKYLCYNEGAQRGFYELGQQVPNLVGMAEGEYLTDARGILAGAKRFPESRGVFLDVMKGFEGASDKVGGKARAQYYTFDSLWYTDMQETLQPVWKGEKTAEEFAAGYAPTLQAALDDMLASYR